MKRLSLKATTTVLVMLCLMYFITYVDRVNISTAAGQFKSEFGLSNTQLGIIFSLSIGVMLFGIVLSFFMKPNIPFSNDATQPRSESQRKEDALSGA
ncbi:sugar phosphate permease [Paraburkholderia sp. MM5496-R1]|nr:hypothetical protein [Paraburkholderia sp. 31.1]